MKPAKKRALNSRRRHTTDIYTHYPSPNALQQLITATKTLTFTKKRRADGNKHNKQSISPHRAGCHRSPLSPCLAWSWSEDLDLNRVTTGDSETRHQLS
ncbi:hypothetical protein E2C01_020513 [Portunus trituberculatus]|uniref:Uncharacterized protein n=1 Tax=Portunus trituberculatus TaxID=210409 RepID=A0A5B7E289_PORTR|nr:hypothetical protein [Portunus trituberculatus]